MARSGSTVTPLTTEASMDPSDLLEFSSSAEMTSSSEHLKILLKQETAFYPLCKDYLSCENFILKSMPMDSDRVSEAWRRKLCEWCFEVVDHFSFDREVVSFALDYLDRTVSVKTNDSCQPLPKREFQLIAVTSLYMAIKIHGETDEKDGPRRKLRIGAFVELSRGIFGVDVIEQMEREILQLLKWRINPPTSLRFISSFLPLCPSWTSEEYHTPHATIIGGIYDVARYLTELSVCVSSFSFTCDTSVTAYAAILCALEALQSSLPLPYRARVAFLNNMAEATGLYPFDSKVRQVYAKLKDLCPSMFEGEDSLPEFSLERSQSISSRSDSVDETCEVGGGKISPVSVMDAHLQEESPRSRRKRSCPTTEEPCPKTSHRYNF